MAFSDQLNLNQMDLDESLDIWGAGDGRGNVAGLPSLGNNNTPVGDEGAWSWFGGKDQNSILGTGLGLGKGAMDAYLGYQQLGVAKDALAFKKDAFSKQFGSQKQLLNTQLRDRQRARLSANPAGHQSVEQYMKESGL